MSLLPKAVPVFKPFNVALIQLGGLVANKAQNLTHAREMILRAATTEGSRAKPHMVVLPECFNSPYGHVHFRLYAEKIGFANGQPYDISKSESETVKMLSSVAKDTGVWIIGGSIPEQDGGKIYNTCTVYSPEGDLIAMHRKVHLFDIDIPGKISFKESETLTGGTSLNFFDTDFARIGLGICYDIRFPEVAMIAARKGCHMLIFPGAFNLTTGPLHWELLQRGRAVDNQVYVSMVSPARDMAAGYHAWGHTMVVDPMGSVIGEASEEEAIIHVHIDPKPFQDARTGIPVTTQRRFDVYPDVCT
jgi:omega-amidase